MESQSIDLRTKQTTAMERAAIGCGYTNMRLSHKQIKDTLYEVTLTIVNRPCGEEGARAYETTREKLDKRMQELVGKHIGEIDHQAVSRGMRTAETGALARLRLQTVSVPDSVGVLESYSISGIRDGSGSLVIVGNVWLSPRAEDMIKTGHYVFAMRSSVDKPHHMKPGCKLEMIYAFDLLLAAEFNPAI